MEKSEHLITNIEKLRKEMITVGMKTICMPTSHLHKPKT